MVLGRAIATTGRRQDLPRNSVCLETDISSRLKSKGKGSLLQKYLRVSSILLRASLSPLIFKSFFFKGPLRPSGLLFHSSTVNWSNSARSSFLSITPPTSLPGKLTTLVRLTASHFNVPSFHLRTLGLATRIKQGELSKSRHCIMGLLIRAYFYAAIF